MRIIALISLLLISACGFSPLYEAGGSSVTMQAKLAAIEVGPIPDRLGQIMRNRLVDRLNASGATDYTLAVALRQSSEGFGVRPDAATTQEQLTLVAVIKLTSNEDGTVLFEQELRARTSFDIVQSDFSTITQREDSARRLVLELAERIHRRLALQFAKS